MGDLTYDSPSYDEEAMASEAIHAISDLFGLNLYPLRDGTVCDFIAVDTLKVPKKIMSGLYWILVDKEDIPNNGEVGENLPIGISFGNSAYYRLDYCFEEDAVMLSCTSYCGVMELPESRRMYVGRSEPKAQGSTVAERISRFGK